MLQKLNGNKRIHRKDLDRIFSVVDKNGDGKIDFSEFSTILQQTRQSQEDEMRSIFNNFDQDGNGYIDQTELIKVFGQCGESLTQAELSVLLDAYDTNKDGHIDFKEFCSLMKNL